MRRSLLAILLVVLTVPAVSGPASARQHSSHYRFARQHVQPVRAENFAPGLYAYAPDAYARDTYAPAVATRETNLRKNNWSQNAWRQSNRSQNSFNPSAPLDGMAASEASANGVPVSLVERVI